MVQLLIAPTILNQVESMASIPELLLTIAVFCLLLMLVNAGIRYLEENEAADRFEAAILKVLNEANTLTGDLGGSATTLEVAEAVKNNL